MGTYISYHINGATGVALWCCKSCCFS
ncbi:hypothetical protein [Nostoc sp.]